MYASGLHDHKAVGQRDGSIVHQPQDMLVETFSVHQVYQSKVERCQATPPRITIATLLYVPRVSSTGDCVPSGGVLQTEANPYPRGCDTD